MARHSPLINSLLVIFLCFLALATYSQESTIDEVCKNHKVPHFCMTFLKDKRESRVPFVAQYSIAAAIAYASESKAKFNSLTRKTSDHRLLEGYKSCSKHYRTAITNLIEAEKFLESEDFAQMNATTVNAVTSLKQCGSSMGPGFDPTLAKKHLDLIYITDIICDSAYVLLNPPATPSANSE